MIVPALIGNQSRQTEKAQGHFISFQTTIYYLLRTMAGAAYTATGTT
jgi:hypothetical protein